jgi:hypothetical protein
LGLNMPSLLVIAVFSCFFESQDGSGHPIARRLLNPREGYTDQDAFNALSDLGALELYIFLSTLRQPPTSLCTCDRAMAAFWCVLGPDSFSYAPGQIIFAVEFSKELFPRLCREEIDAFRNELAAD